MLHDLRYALRMLLKQPGFTLIAVLTLSLGLGATIAIFNVVNAVFWQPLPFQNPDRLVIVWETIPKVGLTENTPAPANYFSWREQSQSFERLAAWQIQIANLTGSGEPEQIAGQKVSADFFPILGVAPTLGRWFLPEEDQPGAAPVVMISHDLWQRRFGSDPNIVGRKLTLNNSSREVIGVMPQSFEDPIPTADYRAQYWMPLALPPEAKQSRSRSLFLIGQLKLNVTPASAQSEMESLVKRLQAEDRMLGDGFGVNVQTLSAQRSLRVRQALWILLAAAAFVLLIGCVNVANLLLVRASWRWRETAIRTALGAGRWRLTRQFVTESLVLGCIGGIGGLVISLWGVSLVTARMPEDLTSARIVTVDWRVLCFTFFASVLTGLACGLAPALQSFRPDLNEALKEGGRNSVVAQIALTLILLIGAGLMLNSFWRLSRVGMGFEPTNLLTLRVALPPAKYLDVTKGRAFFDELLPRLSNLPGVEGVGAISGLPVSFQGGGALFQIEGRVEPDQNTPMTNYRIVNPDYFRVMKIPLLAGREFTQHDRDETQAVAIISQTLAKASWPQESPVGKRVRWGSADGPMMTIVGVVGDVKLHQLSQPTPQLYMPYSQAPFMPYEIALRTTAEPLSLAAAVRYEVWGVDKDLPAARVQTMDQLMSGSLTRERFNVLLLVVLASLALILAAIGIYGVMAYVVAQNTREIGIRISLGAKANDVLKLVIGQGMTLAAIGVGVGVVGALGLTRILRSLLFEVSSNDPFTFTVVPLLLMFVALAACYFPARKATQVDPIVSLRCD